MSDNSRRPKMLAIRAVVAVLLAGGLASAQPTPRDPLQVISFNIRYGTANDGDNHWSLRRAQLFDLLRERDADLVGLQEALASQIDEIEAAVPGYAAIGVGRDDAARAGEFSAILYKKARFRVAGAGTFWFSDTPEVPASKSWGNDIARICTWARFVDRDGRGFYVFNLHLDHQSQPSRERSVTLLRQRIDSRAFPGDPVVVTGDFNAGERNPALTALVSSGDPAAPFVDTYRVRHPDAPVVGTFTGFGMGNTAGEKIDYVLVQPGTEVISAEIIRASRNDRYPSDHFPVAATIRLMDHAAHQGTGKSTAAVPDHHAHRFDNPVEWAKSFDDPARDEWQMPTRVVDALQLTPGMKVADIGAGTGYFTMRLAKTPAAPTVFAVDIEKAMIEHILQRAMHDGLTKRVVGVLAGADRPNLPEPVDLVLMVDTYHHIPNRVAYLTALKERLKPGARLAIIDFRKGAPAGPPEQFRFTPEQISAELSQAGFGLQASHDFLPRQMFLVYGVK
jgi:endonuclease/exonuclease/phosphatase family metal-dependent hydrolase/SAM-dependent methyltransferase